MTIDTPRLRRLPKVQPHVLRYLAGIATLGFTIDGGIFAVLFNLYVLRLGYGPEFVGTLNSIGLLVFAALSLPVGAVQRLSSRRLLLLGMGLAAAGMLATPMASLFDGGWQAIWLVVSRVGTFVGLAFFFVHTAPFVLQITSGADQQRALSWQSAVLALAGFSGGILGGYLPEWFAASGGLTPDSPVPYQYPLLLASLLLVPGWLLIRLIPEPEMSGEAPLSEATLAPVTRVQQLESRPLHWPLRRYVIVIALVRVLQIAAVGVLNVFSKVYFDDGLGISTSRIGIVIAIGRLLGIPVALATPWIMGRWRNYHLVMWTSLITVMAMVPMVWSVNWLIAGAGYIVASSLMSIRYLTFLVYTLRRVPARQHGLISGAGEMAIGFGFAAMSFAGGYLIVWFGYPTLFLASMALSLAGVFLFWLFFRNFDEVA